MKTKVLLLILVAGVVLWAFLMRGILFGEGKPVVYHVPAGFTGWVVIKFEVAKCPPLQEDRDTVHVQIGKNGEVCTCDRLFGSKKTAYVQTAEDGTETILPYNPNDSDINRIWPVSLGRVNYTKGDNTFSVARELFFVGTRKQFDSAWTTKPSLE